MYQLINMVATLAIPRQQHYMSCALMNELSSNGTPNASGAANDDIRCSFF
jgi:hypothetical protein